MNDLANFNSQELMLRENAKGEVRACNEISAPFGLTLSEEAIGRLVTCRVEALQSAGRVEFSGGILPKLIAAFCSSPFIDRENYEVMLADLQEAFYYFKSESGDLFTDDELLEIMAVVFNGRAQGSVEYLTGTSLEALCRWARSGCDEHDADEVGDLF